MNTKPKQGKVVDIHTGECLPPLPQKRFRTPLNYDYRLERGWTTTLPHQTVPDMSLSLREILEKHSRGIATGGQLEALYGGDEGLGINPMTLDLVDIQRLQLMNQEEIAELKLQAAEELKARAAVKAADLKKLQDEQAEAILKRLKEEQAGK